MKKILRSLLFVPADKQKMLDKISSLDADAFILDLEDGVSDKKKVIARNNILSMLPPLKKNKKTIFIRINEIFSPEAEKDIELTFSDLIDGYLIPKFENIEKTCEFIGLLKKLEDKMGLDKTKLILMVESPQGVLELRRLAMQKDNDILERLSGIALGGEDYMEGITLSRILSRDVLLPLINEIVIFCHAYSILAIDTVYPYFSDEEGLRQELKRIMSLGITSKFAIHPSQISIINEMLYPDKADKERMELILSHEKEICSQGAINIDGTMYDMPHLKWAKKIKDYIYKIDKG